MLNRLFIVLFISLGVMQGFSQEKSCCKKEETCTKEEKSSCDKKRGRRNRKNCKKDAKCEKSAESSAVSMETYEDTLSYMIAVMFAKGAEQQLEAGGIYLDSLNKEVFAKTFVDQVKGDTVLFNDEEIRTTLSEYAISQQEKKQKAEMGDEIALLKAAAAREGLELKETPSGLMYAVIQEGTGVTPKPRSKVTVHYHGTLVDGRVFDSSVDRGQPSTFGVNQVIKGWTEGLQLMQEGAKFKFFIPSYLAYGSQARSELIQANTPLVFEVELIQVQ